MSELLHPEIFARTPVYGRRMREALTQRAAEVAVGTAGKDDPFVTVMIRSKRNVPALEMLMDDIEAQAGYTPTKVQVVLVDTDTLPETRALARRRGATLVSIRQKHFSYPYALNEGFIAADHPYVFTLVDHSLLSNRQTLRVATRWHDEPKFGGAFGVSLPNKNATWTERIGAVKLGVHKLLGASAMQVVGDSGMGLMAANCSVVSREAWAAVGGYDLAWGRGGEDGDFGKRLLAEGYELWFDPALSVHHTHGLGPINGMRQLRAWQNMYHPGEFDLNQIRGYRPDLK